MVQPDQRNHRDTATSPADGTPGPTVDTHLLRMVTEYATDGIVVLDLAAVIEWANPAYCRMFGYDLAEIVGRTPLEFCLPAERPPTPAGISAVRARPATAGGLVLHRSRRRNGELFWTQIARSLIPASDGRAAHVVLICRDVTGEIVQREALESAQRQLYEAVETDMLTGLLNREGLYRKLERLLAEGSGAGPRVGLLHIDLDRFKSINDTHGHSAGDAVLYATAERMRRAVTGRDIIARIGGDEFIVVRPDARDADELADFAGRLTDALAQPFDWDDRPLSCAASIGVAGAAPGSTEVEDLVSNADFALYEAKAAGRGAYRLFDRTLRRRKADQQQLSRDIQGAMRDGAFEPWFQPIVDLATARIRGFEVLVRWNHPTRGLLMPGQFLKLVSDLALSHDLDRLMLRLGLDAKRRLRERAGRELFISINTHPDSLGHAGHADEVLMEIDRRGIDPATVMIEVLETARLSDRDDPTAQAIAHLAAGGVRVALDDYGVGYAGIANLTIPGLDCIKIDRSLVRDAVDGGRGEIILRSIAGLCAELGYSLVAEGVETAEDARRLIGLGCHVFQGYWIARAMPFERALAWMATDPVVTLAAQATPPARFAASGA